MAPNAVDEKKSEGYVLEEVNYQSLKTSQDYTPRIIWEQLIFHVAMNLFAVYGVYLAFYSKWLTLLWTLAITFLSGESIIIAAHHGFSHRSFKMTTFAKIMFLFFQVMAGQNSMYTWARDHRLHHKYSDTDADPHNANRGFFFSHVGWLLTTKHPLLIEKYKTIDVSDLKADRLLMAQRQHYIPLYIIIGLIIPVLTPMLLWNESFINSFFVPLCMRYVIVLHITWSINSFAHTFGFRPYDTRIRASQSTIVSFLTLGEGWHNFHHAFPWDYRGTDVGPIGISTSLIDSLARWGLIYDLKTASKKVIEGHARRHGDGTHAGLLAEENPEGGANLVQLMSRDDY